MKLHRSCQTLPLWCFFQIPATGDYRYLEARQIPKGSHPSEVYEELNGIVTEEHSEIWKEILMEYAKLNKDYKLEDVFSKSLLVKKLEGEYNYIMTLVYCLTMDYKSDYSKEYIQSLKDEGYRVNPENKLELFKSLRQIKAQAGAILTRMAFIELEIKNLTKGNETQDSTFDDVMAWVHSHLHVIPDEALTVRRFISYKDQIQRKYVRLKT